MVVWIHTDLVVSGEGVHETEKFMVGCGVHDEVDPWQREVVLWACFVDIGEVNIESPFTIFFFDEYYVSQSLWILHLPDGSCLKEFADLLVDGFLSFGREVPPLLLDRFEGRAAIQPMSDHCRVNSSHVHLLPCEDIFVKFQKLSKESFEVFC